MLFRSDYEKAEEAIKHGEACYLNGHKQHAELITKEAGGERTEVCLLLMHAEDQLMAAETIKLLAVELIELYKKVKCGKGGKHHEKILFILQRRYVYQSAGKQNAENRGCA